jgi:hypothetical protein
MLDFDGSAALRHSALVLLACFLCGGGQAEPLVTDRPGKTETASIVRQGVLQLEGGFKFERQTGGDDPHTDTTTVPELLMRIGILPFAEFRLSADGFVHGDRAGASNHSSGSDLELGVKLRCFDQDGLRPATAVLPAATFPTGGRAVTSDGIDPGVRLLLNWGLSEHFGLDANLRVAGVTQGVSDSRRVLELQPSVSLEASITQRFGAFIEYFATLEPREDEDEHTIDSGVAYRLSDDVQLDLSAGVGLNHASPDFFIGAGVAWRFWTPWARR